MDNSRKGSKNRIGPKYGINDYYNHYKLNCNKHDKNTYKNIINSFFEILSKKIIHDNFEFKLPKRLGVIQLRKFKPTVKLKDGKIVKNFNPIDFKKTKDLWNRDEQAKKDKILVRHLNKHTKGFIFRIKYYYTSANYKNKKIYTFTAIRRIKKLITKATHENNIDAYLE